MISAINILIHSKHDFELCHVQKLLKKRGGEKKKSRPTDNINESDMKKYFVRPCFLGFFSSLCIEV